MKSRLVSLTILINLLYFSYLRHPDVFYTFLHTFGETLGFDMESLPSLDSLQMAMLHDSEEKLLSALTHLLVCAIEDPGIRQRDTAVPAGQWKMPAADKISCNPLKIDAGEYPDTEAYTMFKWLKRKLFLALNPTQNAVVLAFMVNELRQNTAVIGRIDGAIEVTIKGSRNQL